MWCGPLAVAHVTGWTPDQVWLHCRWHREQRGQRFSDAPRGGTYLHELDDAFRRAGFRMVKLWPSDRRVRYGDFVKNEGKVGRWFLVQHGHYFSRKPGDAVRKPNAIILQAYKIERIQ